MLDSDYKYSKNPGDFVILSITGALTNFIGEIKENGYIKVEESGPISNLKPGDYIIDTVLTSLYQKAGANKADIAPFRQAIQNIKLYSGLTSLFGKKVHPAENVEFEFE
jgi:hypothetical protein